MKTFTIENETNHITAHPTLQAAESVAGAERFATAAALGALAFHRPAARLAGVDHDHLEHRLAGGVGARRRPVLPRA